MPKPRGLSIEQLRSKRLPKWRQHFFKKILPKSSKFVYLVPYDFVQISPACGPNIDQIMYGETLNFQRQRQ